MTEAETVGALDALGPSDQVLVSGSPRTDLVAELPGTAGDVVVVAVRSEPEEIEASLRVTGLDPERATVVPVGLESPGYQGPLSVTDTVRPTNLGKVGLLLSRAVDEAAGEPWLVVDDLSILLMYCERDRVARFLEAVTRRIRARPARGLFGVVRSSMSEETYARLRALCDDEIDLQGRG